MGQTQHRPVHHSSSLFVGEQLQHLKHHFPEELHLAAVDAGRALQQHGGLGEVHHRLAAIEGDVGPAQLAEVLTQELGSQSRSAVLLEESENTNGDQENVSSAPLSNSLTYIILNDLKHHSVDHSLTTSSL